MNDLRESQVSTRPGHDGEGAQHRNPGLFSRLKCLIRHDWLTVAKLSVDGFNVQACRRCQLHRRWWPQKWKRSGSWEKFLPYY